MNKTTSIDFDCRYHVVFCPKYRRKILTGEISKTVEVVFKRVSKEYGFEILELSINPTYCDLIIKCDPFFGIAECIKKLKLSSASELKKNFPELMKRIPNIWTRQVFIRTLGNSTVNDMIDFIEAQSKK